MEMTGEQRIPRSRDEVWNALNDPDLLKACVPGCQDMEKLSDTEFKATVSTKIGPVKSRFKGTITLSDMDPPNSYTLSFKGDGTAGFIKGGADVRLKPDGDAATIVEYTARATVGGKLAQVGSRLIDGAARKMANEFFTSLGRELGQPDATGPEAPPATAAPDQEAQAEPMPPTDEDDASGAGPAPQAEVVEEQPLPQAAADQREPRSQPAGSGPARAGVTEKENRRALWVAGAIVVVLVIAYFGFT